jgi:NAD-dependent dihydropyrimidine dehydrogenase PreA subunit
MAYVINEPCIGTKDNSCVEVCPVDCIHPTPRRTRLPRPRRSDAHDGRLPAGHRHEPVIGRSTRPSRCFRPGVCPPIATGRKKRLPARDLEWAGRRRNLSRAGNFFEAAEGTRTLDLLHGKQTKTAWLSRFVPAMGQIPCLGNAAACTAFRRVSPGFCAPIVHRAARPIGSLAAGAATCSCTAQLSCWLTRSSAWFAAALLEASSIRVPTAAAEVSALVERQALVRPPPDAGGGRHRHRPARRCAGSH